MLAFHRRFGSKTYGRYYEGETTATPPGNTTTPPPAATGAVNKTFTQDEVNALLATNKRTLQDQNRQLAADLSKFKETHQLNEQQNQELEARIQQLTSTYQTEAETAAIARKQLEKKATEAQQALTTERDGWKGRFERKLVAVEVAQASIEHNAWAAEQISAILDPVTKVVEELDEAGKPTGSFVTKVDFAGEDKDGKPVKLSLSVAEAVKVMKTMPKHGNLFKSDGAGGVGAQPNGGPVASGRLPSLDNMTTQDYLKHRTQVRREMANTRG